MIRLRRLPQPVQLAAANGLLAVFTFASGVLLARALGADGRGTYAALFLWASIVSNICASGSQFTLARDAAQNPSQVAALYRTAYRIAGLGGLVGGLAYLAIFVPLTAGQPGYTLYLVGLGASLVPFSLPNAFNVQMELGRGRYASYNVVRMLFALINFLTIGILAASGSHSLNTFFGAVVLTTLLASALAVLWVRPSLRGLPKESSPSVASTLRKSAPLAASLLVAGLAQQSDRLFATAVLPVAQVGIYVVAAALAQIQGLVGEALAQMFFARGAAVREVSEIDPVWLGRRLRQTILIYATLCAGALIVLPWLVPIVYGPAFAASAPLLYLLLPGVALQGATRPFEELLRGLNLAPILVAMSLSVLLVSAGAAAVAHITASVAALAAGVIVGYGLALVIATVSLARKVGIPVFDLWLVRPSDAADLMRHAGQWVGVARSEKRRGS